MANVKLVEALYSLDYLLADLNFLLYYQLILEYVCKTSVTKLHDDPATEGVVVNKVLMNLHCVFVLGFTHNLGFIDNSLLRLKVEEYSFKSEELSVSACFKHSTKRAWPN